MKTRRIRIGPLQLRDRSEKVIGLESVVPKTGAYMYGNEKIEWSYKDVTKVLKLWIKMKLAGPLEFKCDHLDISTAIDHGKGHSRIRTTFIARWQTENEEWKEEEYSCTIGNARCKKDNSEIIKNTFGPSLNSHLKELRDAGRLRHVRRYDRSKLSKPS